MNCANKLCHMNCANKLCLMNCANKLDNIEHKTHNTEHKKEHKTKMLKLTLHKT